MKGENKMCVSSSTSIYFIILLLSFFLLHSHVLAEDPIIQRCSDTANYTSNSRFDTNLKLFLFSLHNNGTRDGFFNTSIGTGPDTVYGLVGCRGDLLEQRCQICLHNSTVDVLRICPKRKQALLLYGDCILRYSNNPNAFSRVDTNNLALYNTGKVSDADAVQFNQQLSTLLNNLTSNAVSLPTRYDFGRIDYKPFQPIEGLVQCVRDLSDTDCRMCLENLMSYIPNCCSNNQGGLFYTSSCFLRFELYPFLQIQSQTFPPPPQSNVVPTFSPPPQSNDVPSPGTGKKKSTKVLTIVVPLVIGLLLLLAISAYLTHWQLRRNKRSKNPEINVVGEDDMGNEQSLHFNFDTIKMATNDFSDANKLGEGGFGAVYKGELLNGQEIAVKRLSKHSQQGSKEFQNEVVLLHKLQHRNLVRLLGFCLSGEEQLLIYEYLPNTSLDKYIFDQTKKACLNWEMRYKIIEGIARGLLYLHEDSRLRIIHRDLKAANILLDEEMNAKIADFGLAKLFGVDQTQGNTVRIAGTLGYMAPEYALHGLFSVKSDVFSFGVLLLEIVSGRKSNDYYASGPSRNLLNHAWKLWREGNALELIDPILTDNLQAHEALRCIQMGLLCVQENIKDRPTMSSVVLMLNSYSIILTSPSAPAFSLVTITDAKDGSGEMESTDSGSESRSLPYSDDGVSYPR